MEKECPVDFIHVNENKVRLTALWVYILVTISLFIVSLPIIIFLGIDFFLRGFNFGKYSVLNLLSETFVKQFKISNKPIDQAPKRFAAKIGFILSVLIIITLLLPFYKIAFGLAVVLAIFSFLESFLGFCAGCYVYTFMQKLKLIR